MQNAPAEVIKINPESLEIANEYLQTQNAKEVANMLGISAQEVSEVLARKEVREYVNQVFFDIGYNNRVKMRSAMDAVIKRKFQDLEEAETGSSKDIADLLALSHKFTMELMDKELQLEKLRSVDIKTQTNIQINGGGNYNSLLERLIEDDKE
jgi:flagellar motor switch/type III secretory pathway protein FliN